MPSNVIPEVLAIDTQVFVATSFNFDGPTFQSLKTHLDSGRLRLMLTDITVREVRARIAKSVAEELAIQKRFRKESRALHNSSLAEAKAALAKISEQEIVDDLIEQFDQFLQDADAEIIDTTEVQAGPVFKKYFAEEPPFALGDKKKFEFPDAFAIQALAEWTGEHNQEIFVVSGDEQFRNGCQCFPLMHPKASLAEVLDHVASDDKKLADFIRSETVKRKDAIAKEAKGLFEDFHFWVHDEDGEVEISVTDIEFDGDTEIIEAKPTECTVQMTFSVKFNAYLTYNDATTGIYDHEDGRMMFMEEREETIPRDEILVVDVHATFDGTDPDSFDIDSVDVVDPAKGYAIRTREASEWPYK